MKIFRTFTRPVAVCLAGLFLITVANVGVAAAQAASGTIAGSVLAHDDGRPIAGASVTIDGSSLSATVSPLGRFWLPAVPAGRVTVVVSMPGFVDVRVPGVEVRNGATTPLEVLLQATPNFLDHVLVTATKTDVSAGNISAQTDVVDRATINARGDQTLVQAISHVPGAVVSTELGIFDSVMLRGMPRGDPEFTNTLLLVDGIPQTTSSNGSRVVALPINDASDIEIVRGPGSALYGRTAIGGAVNVRTADPSPTREFGVDLTGGEFGTRKGVVNASGPLSSWGGYYVSAASERNNGYFVSQTVSDFSAGNDALFGKIAFVPNKRSSGSISLNRVVSDNSTPTNEPIIDGQLLHNLDPRFDRLTNFNLPGVNYHQGETRATLNYSLQFTPTAKFVETFGYRDVLQQFNEDGDFIGSPFDAAAHLVTQYPFSQKLAEHIAYEEARVELTPMIGHLRNTIVLGGSYEHTGGTLASDFIFTDPDTEGWPINYLNPVIPDRSTWQHDTSEPRSYHLGVTGLFAQDMVEAGQRWVFTAAGRYDGLALDNTRGTDPEIEDNFHAFSPKLGATYKVLGTSRNTVNLYASYPQAFLPPRRPSSLVPDDVVIKLQPENIDNYEGGVKGSVAGGRVSFEGTYFWMSENGVVLDKRQGPFFIPTNAGEQKYKGVETGIGLTPSREFSIYANAAFYRSRFGDFVIESADGDETLTGNRLPIAPDLVVSAGLRVLPIASIEGTLNIKHIGDVVTDNENTFTLDPYTLVDAAVTWTHGPLRITLSAHNLFNTEYYWNGSSETADPGRPRQVLVTTSVRIK
jgi:iron complex outermembrane recepter protein